MDDKPEEQKAVKGLPNESYSRVKLRAPNRKTRRAMAKNNRKKGPKRMVRLTDATIIGTKGQQK